MWDCFFFQRNELDGVSIKLKELLLTRTLFDMNINNRKIQAKRQTNNRQGHKEKNETSREEPRRTRVSKSSPVY